MQGTLKSTILTKIRRSKKMVFLRPDFERLAGYDQVGRTLKELTREGRLIRIGYGLYAKARPNVFTGKPMIDAERGFEQVALEALKRLKIDWTYGPAMKAYQQGGTQIPAKLEVVIGQRFHRRIRTDRQELGIV
jgi:hypothetical protein